VTQANALAPNWGQIIFQSANEIAANSVVRKRLDDIQETTDAEKAWWEKRRATIRTEFEKELDEGEKTSTNPSSVDGDTVVVSKA
jgi:translocation protein SEC66